ncbi:hypothetical protein DPMN_137988 [Dreissena polymorpha]|uniref:Uncharacterized protein n=1 Tax=Dreissena polymorpha TaxID=45954 RepID=A0A9D4JGW0_DREPO|nr:hypothetical protein DPMN_137988 [Dreissena polymorpha]
MTNSTNNTIEDIPKDDDKLAEVNSFKFFGATLAKDGSSIAKVRIKIAKTISAIARLRNCMHTLYAG